MKLFIPFRYKLTGIIALIIIALLFAIFSVVQNDIELKFRRLIEDRLQHAQGYVSQRMDDRYLLLRNDATAAGNDKLVLDILIDKTLSTATRNDIISNEVLPKFNNLDILAVTDTEGQLRALQQPKSDIVNALRGSEWFEYALEGDSVAGFVLHNHVFYQGIAMPVFLGPEMIGIVVAGRELTGQDITQIKHTSEVDIVVLDKGARVLATLLSGVSDAQTLQDALDQWLAAREEDPLTVGQPIEVNLGRERFIVLLAVDQTWFVPPYIIARSLDESLSFVITIRENMKALGVVSILMAIAVGFFFAVGISRPIRRLSVATTEVAQENFLHRVDIRSKDEFAKLGDSFNQMIMDLAEKQKIRQAFDKSVSKEVADRMLEQDGQLGGHKEQATIMFADIRGFTSLSEELDESALINLLNEYFSRVNSCVIEEQGVIDKFIGDALMALFGTPIACEHAAYHGLMAAKNMLATVEVFNRQVKMIYGCELNIGIGLNSGEVVAGMVGSKDRMNFTVLGDQVNLASRIEGLCKNYGVSIVLSQSTVDQIVASREVWQEVINFRRLDRVQVKGKSTGLDIYQVFFNDDPAVLSKIAQYETALSHLIDGKLELALSQLQVLGSQWTDDIPTQQLLQECELYIKDRRVFEKEYRQGVRVLLAK